MLTSEDLIEKCHQLARSDSKELDADSLIGFFQAFRPDGEGLSGLFDHLEDEQELLGRLGAVYAAAGDGRRGDGSRDAYFVVRNPPAIEPEDAADLANRWLGGLCALALHLKDDVLTQTLDPIPDVRVLEGLPPKHPKAQSERSKLLRSLQDEADTLLQRVDGGNATAAALGSAYYFVACDSMLRDYLMWPLYADMISEQGGDQAVADPFEPYFQLWRHGVKYRIFDDRQVSLYLPRKS